MATFALTSVASSVIGKQNSIFNTLNKTPVGNLFQNDKWKNDKLSFRLKDLTIQKSAYNEIIPIIYGKNRIAGNIIWATDIKEVEKVTVTTSGGGKGSPRVSQTNRTYYYYANLAIALCQGEVSSLNKVWANTELLNLSKYKIRFYKGTENQMSDPLIQGVQGVENTPAYRGLCYAVFEEFPLADFGNRIPNFTFEITRKVGVDKNPDDKLENMITAVNVIPGCGEFVYDTVVQYKKEGSVINGAWKEYGKKRRLNQNNNSGKADSLVSLDQLQSDLPKCNWIAPVAVWFGDSLNLSNCTIKPRVEYGNDSEGYPIYTEPDEWRVGNWTRFNTPVVGKVGNTLRYGGTVNDASLVRYLKEVKNRGFNVMFYPMMFMDVDQKPWRGHLTGNSRDVHSFFTKTNGYNEFILHYANLVKDHVDAFIIGSELIGLTSIRDENDNFPAVDCLINLASAVRNILGLNIKISYAADWSEYHHTTGGWYHMDKLWASPNIDFIGIDAYFPLTDKKQSMITKQDIMDGWESGEGYDWYYTDSERTTKENLSPEYAWKNIDWWWKNHHVNPDGEQTEWIPESKKIWFTEYGFSSVDGTSNESNRFYDPESFDGGFPRFSEGRADYFVQRQALQVTEEKWKNSDMIERKFVWCYDARPYPFYPNKMDVWSDGNLWKYGHWLNGKLGGMSVSDLVYGIFDDISMDWNIVKKTTIYDNVEGIAINNRISTNDLLDILQRVYFFDYVEDDGGVSFLSKNTESLYEIKESDLILLRTEGERKVYIETDVVANSELPERLELSFINKDFDYQLGNTYSERNSVETGKVDFKSIPAVLSEHKARQVAETSLYSEWLERMIYTFVLPIKYLHLEPTDVVTLKCDNLPLKLKVINISLDKNNNIRVSAVRHDSLIFKNRIESDDVSENIKTIPVAGDTNLEIFELPAIGNKDLDKPKIYFAVNKQENDWKGCVVYDSANGGGSFNVINETRANSITGVCCNVLGEGNPYYFDYENEVIVYFDDRINMENVNNVTESDLFSGANIALIGKEIIQFKEINLQEDGTYRLKGLLRGLFGTEKEIVDHSENENFILLNHNLLEHVAENCDIGLSKQYKAVSIGEDLSEVQSLNYVLKGKRLRPLPPTHLEMEKDSEGDVMIRWKRRSRGYGGWRDNVDVPLVEKSENYEIEILDDEKIVRIEEIKDRTFFEYTSEMQYLDFGGLVEYLKIRVYQISDIVGRGGYCEKALVK